MGIKEYNYRIVVVMLFIVLTSPVLLSQIDIDYQSTVTTDNNAPRLMSNGFQKLGPYSAYGRIWAFYSNGSDAVWRTKHVEEGGDWSAEQSIFQFQPNGEHKFSVYFDGTYFHFVWRQADDLNYKRGKALITGEIEFTPHVTVFSDPQWSVQNVDFFSITVDRNYHPWIMVGVISGDLRKPVMLSSIDTEGGWENRPGWPKDLQGTNTNQFHGHATMTVQLDDDNLLFVWRDQINARISARLWTADQDPDGEGTLGSLEDTGLTSESARVSSLSPAEGVALVNSSQTVARRNENGTWQSVNPPAGLLQSYWSSMSMKDGVIRLWDIDANQNVRYRETSDFGDNWSSIVTKYPLGNAVQLSASQTGKSTGSHHSVMIATGSGSTFDPPFDLIMGIEGNYPVPPAPTLVSPADGADDLPGSVTFSWNAVKDAASFNFEISTDPDFTELSFNQSGISDTTIEVSNIELNNSYYWRVQAVTVGGTESDWSAVRQFATVGIPPAPVLVSPSNEAQNIPTSLTLSWNDAAGAETYQLQVATVSDFSATLANVTGIVNTEYEITGLDNDRTYYWRVRATNQFGDGEWSQVWSFSTLIGIPSAPVLLTPEHQAIDQPVVLTFDWEDADLADTYRLQVSKVSNFSSTEVNVGNIQQSSYEVTSLEYSTTYYWRVNATNQSGTSAWSSVRSFTTIIEEPAVPQLTAPADNADAVSTKPNLDWEDAVRVETYRVQVATDSEFDTVVLDVEGLETSSYSVPDELDEFTLHYWRVNATNIGGTSDWSEVWQFTTGRAFPVPPTLVSPANGGTNVTNALMLWNSVETATHYRLQVAKSDDFAEPAVDNASVTNTFYEATNLEQFTQYFWRVRAISDVGAGDWSVTWSFTTGAIVSVERFDDQIPTEFALGQNYPNPFNPTTRIQFALPQDATVRLEVYNMLGQRIATLIDGEYFNAGIFEAEWNARDDAGHEVSSGLYIYRISAGDYVNMKKMLFTK
jgi:hypothetical protein